MKRLRSLTRSILPPGRRAADVLVAAVLLSSISFGIACSSPVSAPGASADQRVRIVAAENFYGDVATQIGGDRVSVVSILSDPSTDPHAYESNSGDARAVANAQLVVKNGLGYDAFLDKLLSASPRPNRIVVDVGGLTGYKDGDNPHMWYDPAAMPMVAERLTDALSQLDPAGKEYYAGRLQNFNSAFKHLNDQVVAIREKYRGANILATEPIFDYMAAALGLNQVGKGGAFQKAVEQGNDPPASAVAEVRQQLASRQIRVLIYNSQAITPITTQLQDFARQNGVAVVAISETQPAGTTYQQWILEELKALQQALGG